MTFRLPCCAALAAALAIAQPSVTTSQYNSARTGANLGECILTPRNVKAKSFGKLFRLPVDGAIYAQPLYMPRVKVPGKGVHDIVFVATEHNSVYAFDAAGSSSTPLWHVSFNRPNVTPVPARDLNCPLIVPEVGITATPVIDPATGTMYVLARTKELRSFFRSAYVHKLHALAISTGAEKFGGPVEIDASVWGRGDGATLGHLPFDTLHANPRAALLLADGRVYLTWASSCDVGPYHGWVMVYDAQTLNQLAVLNTSPDAGASGIWLSDTGPAADGAGNIYIVTGNGQFDVSTGGRDYGDSVLKLRMGGHGLLIADYFTPYNQTQLNQNDEDLGSGGPVLLPDESGPHRRLLLAGGKGGTLYVVDRDRMGQHHTGSDAHAVQTLQFPKLALFGAPAYWNGHVYVIAGSDVLREFAFRSGQFVPAHAGPFKFPDGGATPAVSANGASDGLVWAIATFNWINAGPPTVLHAYDALNVGQELYNSEQNAARDRAGPALRFTIPTVINGRVYVGARGELDVYGLLRESK
jgi:hypothetical protein